MKRTGDGLDWGKVDSIHMIDGANCLRGHRGQRDRIAPRDVLIDVYKSDPAIDEESSIGSDADLGYALRWDSTWNNDKTKVHQMLFSFCVVCSRMSTIQRLGFEIRGKTGGRASTVYRTTTGWASGLKLFQVRLIWRELNVNMSIDNGDRARFRCALKK